MKICALYKNSNGSNTINIILKVKCLNKKLKYKIFSYSILVIIEYELITVMLSIVLICTSNISFTNIVLYYY